MIGATVWHFDENRRVYTHDDGTRSSGPIWRKHWEPWVIVGETSRSWIALPSSWYIKDPASKFARKLPKKGVLSTWCWSEEEIDRRAWAREHKYKIADRVQRVVDPDVLKKIAELVGYEPKERK